MAFDVSNGFGGPPGSFCGRWRGNKLNGESGTACFTGADDVGAALAAGAAEVAGAAAGVATFTGSVRGMSLVSPTGF